LQSRHSTGAAVYVTPTAATHLTLPPRSRDHPGGPVTSSAGAPAARRGRHASPVSHFSWPGASFDFVGGLADDLPEDSTDAASVCIGLYIAVGGLADDDEGRSSAGTTQGGAGEPTTDSPSLPSSTSTATNSRHAAGHAAGDDDVTPCSNGDADTEIADVTTHGGDVIIVARSGDVIAAGDAGASMRRRRSCEFNLLDDDDSSWGRGDDVTGRRAEWAWPAEEEEAAAAETRSEWSDVLCVNDELATPTAAAATPTSATATPTAAAAAAEDNNNEHKHDDDDDDDELRSDDVGGQAINETVMKCIESCDKVLLRHSTAIR